MNIMLITGGAIIMASISGAVCFLFGMVVLLALALTLVVLYAQDQAAEYEHLERQAEAAEEAHVEEVRAAVRVAEEWRTAASEAQAQAERALSVRAHAEKLAAFDKGESKVTPRQLRGYIRRAHQIQFRIGRNVRGTIYLDVESGWVCLDWEANCQGACVPMVSCRRDGLNLFKEWAYRGRYTEQLDPGRHQYRFEYKPSDYQRSAMEDLEFQLPMPTSEAWKRTSTPTPAPAAPAPAPVVADVPAPKTETERERRKRELGARFERAAEDHEIRAEIKREYADRLKAAGVADKEIQLQMARIEAELTRNHRPPNERHTPSVADVLKVDVTRRP